MMSAVGCALSTRSLPIPEPLLTRVGVSEHIYFGALKISI
jgi:hypothetical protein